MYLKKETSLGLSEIKDRLKCNDYIFLYELDNDKGLKKINVVKRELAKQGLTVQLFENDEEENPELFDNLEEMHREIALSVGLTDEDIDSLY